MKTVGREIMWNLPPLAAVIMYSLLGMVILIFAWGLSERVRAYRRGREEREDRLDNLWDRAGDALKIGVGQQKVLERKAGGLMHLAVYSAFIVLFLATCLVAVEYDFGIPVLDGNFYLGFKLFVDTFGLLLLAGIFIALVRRYLFRPKGLTRDGNDLLQLLLIGAIGVTGFLVEAVRIAATHPAAAPVSFVSNAISPLFAGASLGSLLSLHQGLWWTHLLLAFGFLATIPFTKMFHMGAGVVNIFLRSSRPKGALQPVPNIEEEERPGAVNVEDFSWKQLLSSDACTKCGRCQDECPAFAAEMPLSPRDVVLKTKDQMSRDQFHRLVPSAAPIDKKTGKPVVPPFTSEVLLPDEIWACTTCRACMEACPVLIEHIDMIVDVRRGYVADAKIPDSARTALRKMGDTGNPWGLPRDDRTQWARGLSVPFASDKKEFEYLYWVGCAGAYDPRNQKVTRTIVSLLNRAGVDYATLGHEEMCCGESARRLGEEGLFQLGMVEMVKEVFASYRVKKVITQCPHCFNTFRNEYPQFGVNVEVIHHSVLLRNLIEEGKITPTKPINRLVAFHDSCYLGRHNDIYDAPREALQSIPGITVNEPEKSRERGFCCGAGGGGMWLEIPGKRINHIRFDQLMRTGANATTSSCPYCLTMFDDAIKFHNLDDSVQAKDIAELVAESL
ncbi:MAG: heterodisulfide reductase-related iron-sulfur binding cluster [Thermodesulfobacteriota bacterium]|nr:heterodisulfide reductase-related iron-sulfur binding cluster [Thermodesulfobacteriota bacterium]